MKKTCISVQCAVTLMACFLAAVLIVPAAVAGTITFDESAATNDNSAYSAMIDGVMFSATNAGTWGGNSNGNPGNWGLEGTNGPQFLGFNGANNGYSEMLMFMSPVNHFSADFSRSNGSMAMDEMIMVDAYQMMGGPVIGSAMVMPGPINSWTTIDINAPGITMITWSGTSMMGMFHPYGVDNVTFSNTPEPSSLLLFGSGLLGAVGILRRKINL